LGPRGRISTSSVRPRVARKPASASSGLNFFEKTGVFFLAAIKIRV
jgi:hypothetical protein